MAEENEYWTDDEDSVPVQSARTRSRYHWRRDPVAVALVGAIFAVVILALTAGLYAAVSYRSSSNAPRTREEKELAYLAETVKTNPKSLQAWYDYAQVLIEVGQYNRASAALDDAQEIIGDDPSLDVQRARILYEKGRYESAIEKATQARKREYANEEKEISEQQKQGYKVTVEGFSDQTVIAASVLIGEAQTELGNLDEAIAAYTAALGEDPKMADVLAARGDLYEKNGDFAKAAEDYKAALKYVPDMEDAIKGLERTENGSGK